MNRQALSKLLEEYNIPVDAWGTGESKTFEHLVEEVVSGESIVKPQGKRLVRIANGSAVNIYYCGNGPRLKLVEDQQVFVDGRARKRPQIDTSIGEKLRPGEDPLDGALRALKEELGVEFGGVLRYLYHRVKGPEESKSFPGLLTVYKLDYFEATFSLEDYREGGYVEVQKDKTSYFVWVPYEKDQKAG